MQAAPSSARETESASNRLENIGAGRPLVGGEEDESLDDDDLNLDKGKLNLS